MPAVEAGSPWRPLAQGPQLVLAHHREVDGDGGPRIQAVYGIGDPLVDLGPQRAARNGEGDLDRDVASGDGHVLDHSEVDDAAMELRILDRS